MSRYHSSVATGPMPWWCHDVLLLYTLAALGSISVCRRKTACWAEGGVWSNERELWSNPVATLTTCSIWGKLFNLPSCCASAFQSRTDEGAVSKLPGGSSNPLSEMNGHCQAGGNVETHKQGFQANRIKRDKAWCQSNWTSTDGNVFQFI